MRRSFLLTASALGLLICLLAGTGLFAALVDTAETGQNDVDTAPLAGSSDLQLALWDSVNGCGTWQEGLSTGLISASNVAMPTVVPGQTFCIHNAGSRSVDVTVSVFDVTDEETTGCTGDEADSGDLSCDPGDPGELAAATFVEFFITDCAGNATTGYSDYFTDLTTTPLSLVPIASGNTNCFDSQVQAGSVATETQVQQAQSDSLTWRYRFTGTATP